MTILDCAVVIDRVRRARRARRYVAPIAYPDIKHTRDQLRAERRCICGPKFGNVGRSGVVHGRVIRSGKCARCLLVHKGISPETITADDIARVEAGA